LISTATGCGLDNWSLIPGKNRGFSVLCNSKAVSDEHPATTAYYFPGVKKLECEMTIPVDLMLMS